MKLTDERLLNFLDKRLAEKGIDKDKFLNPKLSDLRDAMCLKNMPEAVTKIKNAIKSKKKILVFGDYDCDGICASTMLYLFLKSHGADVNVFIPNRFDEGYGISVEAIDEIEFEYAPSLVITVDLGITAIEEVEILKQEGIDIVITDHHIPLSELPATEVVNPKVDPEKTYGFDALCGAGVALKLIEALSDREEALKYLDLCAIATVGDIVPLIDENRVIAKFGIEKINRGECLPSIAFMLKKLELEDISSTDIGFKIVPRINACGRMSNAKKVFEFLIETEPKQLEIKYTEIEVDNTLRLSAIEQGKKQIAKILSEHDYSEPSALISGDFHEGVIGILASHVCQMLGKPAIIFTSTAEGTLKGSGRSIASIDLHEVISKLGGLLINFGGHKMACGVEIAPENFDEFKREFNQLLKDEMSKTLPEASENDYDIEITDNDFNLHFLNELEVLEPFGCENEKPVFAIRQGKMLAEPVSDRTFKHFRLFTKENNIIVAFNGCEAAQICKNDCEKMLIVDFGKNIYKGKTSLSVVLKKLCLLSVENCKRTELDFLASLRNKYYSLLDFNTPKNYHIFDGENIPEVLKNFDDNGFGTIIFTSTVDDLKMLKKIGIDTKNLFSFNPSKTCKNTIVFAPALSYKKEDAFGYKNIIFMHSAFESEHLYFSKLANTYENKTILEGVKNLKTDRETFAKVYKLVVEFNNIKASSEIELAEKLAFRERTLSASQILFCILVFMELNFIEFDEVLCQMKVLKAKKMELKLSKLYMEVCDGQ